ncbi:hypothetical protein AB6735_18525 [Mucilaginibacter sp. RCC_168]
MKKNGVFDSVSAVFEANFNEPKIKTKNTSTTNYQLTTINTPPTGSIPAA